MTQRRTRSLNSASGLVEAAGWSVAFFLAFQVRQMPWFEGFGEIPAFSDQLPFLAIGLATWFIARAVSPIRTKDAWQDFAGTLQHSAFVALAVVVCIFVFRLDFSRIFLGLWLLIGTTLTMSLRGGSRWVARNSDGFERRIAVVGDGALPHRIAQFIQKHEEWGWRYAGSVPIQRADETPGPRLGTLDDIQRIIEENVIDEVLFVVGHANLEAIEGAFLTCEEVGIDTRLILDFFPHKISRMTLDQVDGFPALVFEASAGNDVLRILKRLFDIAISLGFLVFGIPVFLTVALSVKLQDGGDILFAQERVGRHGRPFLLYKFRSMVADAEDMKQQLLERNEREGPAFKMANDPRVTQVGRFIRKTSLDEIPQFYNVLIGDMSIVGPRPPLPTEVEQYDRWQRRRLSVRPGITCLWQVSGRGDVDFETWMRMDLAYIDNWSLWLDLKIFLMTIPAVLMQRGST